MAGVEVEGPTLTYVTDPALDLPQQQRVVREFVRCAPHGTLRVAFRLPDASDDDVSDLLEWYLPVVEQERVDDLLLTPLVHNRPAVTAAYETTRLWMPARSMGAVPEAYVYSVHSPDEGMRAVQAGAREVMFGHVFASESHPGEPGRGINALTTAARAVAGGTEAPVVTAIGGIIEATIGELAGTGVTGAACIRAISRSPDIAATVDVMRQEWQRNTLRKDINP